MRNTVLTILLLLLAAPHVRAQREVYERYAQRDNLFVAYAQGYRLDSVTRVDAILIQAKDSAAWEWMREEFDLDGDDPNREERAQHGVVGKMAPLNDLSATIALRDVKEGETYCAIISMLHEQYLGIFFVQTPEQSEKVLQLYISVYNDYVAKRYKMGQNSNH